MYADDDDAPPLLVSQQDEADAIDLMGMGMQPPAPAAAVAASALLTAAEIATRRRKLDRRIELRRQAKARKQSEEAAAAAAASFPMPTPQQQAQAQAHVQAHVQALYQQQQMHGGAAAAAAGPASKKAKTTPAAAAASSYTDAAFLSAPYAASSIAAAAGVDSDSQAFYLSARQYEYIHSLLVPAGIADLDAWLADTADTAHAHMGDSGALWAKRAKEITKKMEAYGPKFGIPFFQAWGRLSKLPGAPVDEAGTTPKVRFHRLVYAVMERLLDELMAGAKHNEAGTAAFVALEAIVKSSKGQGKPPPSRAAPKRRRPTVAAEVDDHDVSEQVAADPFAPLPPLLGSPVRDLDERDMTLHSPVHPEDALASPLQMAYGRHQAAADASQHLFDLSQQHEDRQDLNLGPPADFTALFPQPLPPLPPATSVAATPAHYLYASPLPDSPGPFVGTYDSEEVPAAAGDPVYNLSPLTLCRDCDKPVAGMLNQCEECAGGVGGSQGTGGRAGGGTCQVCECVLPAGMPCQVCKYV